MGCLNSNNGFEHWFGNIHLSGPCNRECYFCIGQHMMDLDSENNLDTWPIQGLDDFIDKCKERNVTDINITGTNTDPLLFKHMVELREALAAEIEGLRFGIRTNGVLIQNRPEVWEVFDKASITVCSFDPAIYKAMMGRGKPPQLEEILKIDGPRNVKINVVLGPENVETGDIFRTLDECARLGIKRVNLREPYGQSHIGDPLAAMGVVPDGHHLGMPFYDWKGAQVTYWDVHYVEVESVNLYANGRVSELYPITAGHSENGEVKDQSHFTTGRHRDQWVGNKKLPVLT